MLGGIGILELLVIFGVGLFVIGPERLPETIKTCALWFGRIKRNLLETRQELEQHLGADEIRRELHNEQMLASLEKFRSQADSLKERIDGHLQNSSDVSAQSGTTIDQVHEKHDSDNHVSEQHADASSHHDIQHRHNDRPQDSDDSPHIEQHAGNTSADHPPNNTP